MPPDWMGPAWRYRDPHDNRDAPQIGRHRPVPKRKIPLAGLRKLAVPAVPWSAAPLLSPPAGTTPRKSRLAAVAGVIALCGAAATLPVLATAMVLDRAGVASGSGYGWHGWGGTSFAGWFAPSLAACFLLSHVGGILAQALDGGRRQWGPWAVVGFWLSAALGFPLDWVLALFFGVLAGP